MEHLLPFIEVQLTNPKVSIEEIYTGLEQVHQYNLAALIVPPFWVKKLRRDWGAANQAILGTVVGFPLGFQRTEVKQLETELALQDGANDIEVTLNSSAWFSTQNKWVKIELAKLGKLIHQQESFFTVGIRAVDFDVINLERSIKDAVDAGADFIKIYRNLDVDKSLEIYKWLPESVGLKIYVGSTTFKEMELLIAGGIERICVMKFVKNN
ncbi:deoxyribose-phosphate aldolase [Emticicia agri]|uniref:Deoxyribose-phosphate aldolase n=1 Tax=Emticicia agri TaxID=2492393 RepID=A0A4Q5M6I6_9BACT|nr:deoxyribose-phosphate aldolase [Emticicia agri]RYU97683.1 deoxyribose-phosphate aldolase [Emticicia agri]